jgi:2-polyprenyl-6-methoxyphenol hydroxylase-like FAD-dependent oxidoreductase
MRKSIAIIGAGLSGSIAALVLARAGYLVTLVDRHPIYPVEFRVEKLAGVQIALLRRVGLLDLFASAATPFDNILNVRGGQIVDRTRELHYAMRYDDMVRLVRSALPSTVEFIFDRAVDIKTSAEKQHIVLSRGQTHTPDLLVLASGFGDLLRHKLGIERRMVAEKQSITFGFSLKPEPGREIDFEALTYYGSGITDSIDYLSLFPLGDVLRANMFTFLDHHDPWIRELRRDTIPTLHKALPSLRQFLGEFEIVEPVTNWTMDLTVAENVEQHGVVVIGDAFQTSCPAAGTGVTRLLTDIDRLCNVHIPKWLETPGLGKEKIAEFYRDPEKLAVDAQAMRLAHYRRSLTVDPSLRWNLRRRQHFLRRRLVGLMDRIGPALAGQLKNRARGAGRA